MKLTIEKQRDTPLLSRKRVTAMLTFDSSTPSRMKMRDAIAKKTSEEPENVIIKHIYQRFGNRTARVIANIYKNRKTLEKYEHKNLVAKHVTKEEPKKEEAPKAESKEEVKADEAPKAEEKPAEKAKEAAPAEEKKE